MEHAVVGAHVGHMPAVLVPLEVLSVGLIAVDDVIPRARRADDHRRGVHHVPQLPLGLHDGAAVVHHVERPITEA